MICPHCRRDVRRRERIGRRCARCRRRFAFDPRSTPLRLHDLRVRAVAEALSTGGRDGGSALPCTPDQLRYALARPVLNKTGWWQRHGDFHHGDPAMQSVVGVGLLVTLCIPLWLMQFGDDVLLVSLAMAGVALMLIVLCALPRLATWGERRLEHPGLPVGRRRFAALLRRWRRVYGEPPAPMVPRAAARVVPPVTAAKAVLWCTDPGTLAFLEAAGLARRQPVVLVPGRARRRPPAAVREGVANGLPVLLLHDADLPGARLAPRLRAALPAARVLDLGLRPRVARAIGPPMHVRPPSRRALGALPPNALDPEERAWLAAGNAVPLAAVLPARLLDAVERAVAVAVAGPAAERAARSVGFLSAPAGAP